MNDQMLSGAGTIIAIVAAQLEMLHRQCSSLPTQPPAVRNIYIKPTIHADHNARKPDNRPRGKT